jgi:hypothetical protein
MPHKFYELAYKQGKKLYGNNFVVHFDYTSKTFTVVKVMKGGKS